MSKGSNPRAQSNTRPLCVDLDGTLIHSDLLVEALLGLLKQQPLTLFLLPFWLLGGKAHFKQQVATRVAPDTKRLPYNQTLLQYLEGEHAAGRRLVLATAANARHAARIAEHVGLFDQVIASDARTNLSGPGKAARLVAEFGERGFDYVGNSEADLAIWSHAHRAVVVNAPESLLARVRQRAEVAHVFTRTPGSLAALLRATRPHQWLKNLLVFIPLVLAHELRDPILLSQALLAFFAFGFCASAVYLLNDLLDLPADRRHPIKRRRPFAAGLLPPQLGLALAPLLLGIAVLLGSVLPPAFLGTLGIYLVLTLAYSVRLKATRLLDVMTLAALYTLRVIAGAAATGIEPSFWLLAFSVFFFISLALVKRYAELKAAEQANIEQPAGRSYLLVDLETLAQAGIASGFSAAMVLALYINNPVVTSLYQHPKLLWLICPVLLYWISFVWLLARRGEMNQDPVLFAIEDRHSHWSFAIIAAIIWAAS
ncbi:MAG: UbiA family prenyltransferase [Gammaproteobacteria bacterium]|nr:UbiA family prenyltransferase [Gammaproteobacteria bacterium]